MSLWQILMLMATVAGTVWALRTIPRLEVTGDEATMRSVAFIGNSSRLMAIWSVFATGWLLTAARPASASTYLTIAALFAGIYLIFGWLADRLCEPMGR